MNKDHMRKNAKGMGSMVMGFMIGGMIGAAAALLMAPQSGDQTRSLIREKGIELKDRTVSSLEGARASAAATIDDTRSMASDKLRGITDRTNELAHKAKERAAEIAGKVSHSDGGSDNVGSTGMLS